MSLAARPSRRLALALVLTLTTTFTAFGAPRVFAAACPLRLDGNSGDELASASVTGPVESVGTIYVCGATSARTGTTIRYAGSTPMGT